MKIAVVDDSSSDRLRLREYLQRYCGEQRLLAEVCELASGEALLQAEQICFDLIFLDIYMGGMDGMTVAKQLRERDVQCLLVFTTTSELHAVGSFRVRAFDYLVKPFTYEQFAEVMRLCEQTLDQSAHYVEVAEGREQVRILLKDILYTDVGGHYIRIYTGDRVVKTRMRFDDFAPLLLSDRRFLNCYRNCIINMDAVDRVAGMDFVMKNGERIPIVKAQNRQLRQHYADYIFETLGRR